MLGKRRACLNGLGLHHVYFNSLSGFQTRLKPPTRTQHRFRKCVCGGGVGLGRLFKFGQAKIKINRKKNKDKKIELLKIVKILICLPARPPMLRACPTKIILSFSKLPITFDTML